MAKRQRRMFSAAESAEVWDRWQRGEGLKRIGRVLGRHSSTIFAHLKPHGGIRPAARHRSRWALSLDDREEISRGLARGASLRSIASRLGRAPSIISRELKRNGGHRLYRAAAADKRAWQRALCPKLCELARHEELRQLVAARLHDNWSPEQIAGWLRHNYPDNEATSATRRARGSVVRTRTPTVSCASTSPRAPTSRCTRKSAWTRSRGSLMGDRARRLASKHRRSVLKRALR